MTRKLHFALTEAEATAVIEATNELHQLGLRRGHPLSRAANKLDEQMAMQNAPWERCPNCDGFGWIEDGP